jgi:hypothetical protein
MPDQSIASTAENLWLRNEFRFVLSLIRTKAIGPIAEEQIFGKLILKVWPLNQIGTI